MLAEDDIMHVGWVRGNCLCSDAALFCSELDERVIENESELLSAEAVAGHFIQFFEKNTTKTLSDEQKRSICEALMAWRSVHGEHGESWGRAAKSAVSEDFRAGMKLLRKQLHRVCVGELDQAVVDGWVDPREYGDGPAFHSASRVERYRTLQKEADDFVSTRSASHSEMAALLRVDTVRSDANAVFEVASGVDESMRRVPRDGAGRAGALLREVLSDTSTLIASAAKGKVDLQMAIGYRHSGIPPSCALDIFDKASSMHGDTVDNRPVSVRVCRHVRGNGMAEHANIADNGVPLRDLFPNAVAIEGDVAHYESYGDAMRALCWACGTDHGFAKVELYDARYDDASDDDDTQGENGDGAK